MRWILILFCCSIYSSSYAHPAWGVAVNQHGEIFFVDMLHNNGTLWQVNTKGELFEVIKNLNSHNVLLDANSNLWIANTNGKNKNTLIKFDSNLKIDTVLFNKETSLFNGNNFTIGNDQSIIFENGNRIYKYSESQSQLLVDHQFNDVASIFIANNGSLYIADNGINNGTLYQLNKKGILKTVARQLITPNPISPLYTGDDRQEILGISEDGFDNIYISENAGCKILKITNNGEISTFYQASTLWSPVNVVFYNGDAYILEIGFNKTDKGPRIIKKSEAGQISRVVNIQTVPSGEVKKAKSNDGEFIIPTWLLFAFGFTVFGLIIILSLRKQHKTN